MAAAAPAPASSGTYFETDKPDPPRIDVAEAARRTVPILDAPPGVVEPVQ